MTTQARFLPWVRARALPGDALEIHASGHVVGVPFSRFGPGDVTGLGPGQIARREPAPDSLTMPPNVFPFVEFARADLPWCVSPAEPDAHNALAPWLALLVIEARDGSPLENVAGALQPVLSLPCDALPAPVELAHWAHLQVDAGSSLGAGDRVDGDVAGRGVARLLSPRALKPLTRYLAALVPAFEAGRLAGLGQPVPDARSADPAWHVGPGAVTLPVYDHWFFTTADSGDLETLARRLRGRDLAASSRPLQLNVGDVTGDVDGRLAPLEGALRPLGDAAAWQGVAVDLAATRLGALLERDAGSAPPVIGLPLYGSTASAVSGVPAAGWMRELNLDPRRRAAAGLGVEIVRAHQDALVDEAWRQAGDIDRARREREGAVLAQWAAARLHARAIAPLAGAHALVTLAPALPRVRDAGHATAALWLDASALPAPALGSAFRRILAVKAPAAARRAGLGVRATLVAQNAIVRSPGALPPAPARLVSGETLRRALTRVVLPPTDVGVGVGVGTPIGVDPGISPLPTGPIGAPTPPVNNPPPVHPPINRRPGILTGVFALTDSQQAVLAAEGLRLDARRPAVVEVLRPRAFDWLSPADARAGAASAATRFAQRVDFGDGARLQGGGGIVATPRFDQPIGAWLDPAFLLAGVDIPVDTAGMLEVNGPFVEALLAGANHELARELLWRGVPLDRQATPLARFFASRAAAAPRDMTPIAQWAPASALGSHLQSGERVVLVLRSLLVGHLSETIVFLAQAEADGAYRRPGATQRLPVFRGSAGLDTAFFGFDLTPAELVAGLGWYVVIQELPHAGRFGFDESGPAALGSWNDLAWPQVSVVGGYVSVAASPPAPTHPAGLQWGTNAAQMAAISLQRRIRVAIHSSLLTPTGS